MSKPQPWKNEGLTKAEWVSREVAKAVNAGKEWELETVDFSDPNRPPTCLEVDFPIIPINQIAAIEGNAGKPIYQMSKWWARRRSSVFRSMLLAAAIKAPDDPAEAAKLVWDVYYGNHQAKGAFRHLKVADIFMGGGTTIVEGTRLGMQMYGNDLNPVAWFIVKNEMAQVDKAEVEALLKQIEAEVKPQIMPFYACDCPRGHKGKWTQVSTGKVMGSEFDPLTLTPQERMDYSYEGPEVIYTFWAKHGPCQVTGCGHRTPILSDPVFAVKSISVKTWLVDCKHCGEEYDLEERFARMAPGVEFVTAATERPHSAAVLDFVGNPKAAVCPHCGKKDTIGKLPRPTKKTVSLQLLIHPDWARGAPSVDESGRSYGGSADDPVEATMRWNSARAATCKLIEFRGELPECFRLADGTMVRTGKLGGTVPGKSNFACGKCGTVQDVLESVKASRKTGPGAIYAVQGYCPDCDHVGEAYGGRFFSPASENTLLARYDAALREWETRKDSDLQDFWPRSEVPYGFMTHKLNGGIPNRGFTHWWKMFNPRQLLVNAAILRTISGCNNSTVGEFVLGAFQSFIRNNCLMAFWHKTRDHFAPALSNSNFHPKDSSIEVGAFSQNGYGPWPSTLGNLRDSLDWATEPYELVPSGRAIETMPALAGHLTGVSEKAFCHDPLIRPITAGNSLGLEQITCGSSTELEKLGTHSYDVVITDPPFGGLLHYSELSDFFYVWLRLALKDKYPRYFTNPDTPKTMEAVANRARHPGADVGNKRHHADIFYQRLLTACWAEARRILKPGGILSFTFHHSDDAPWVSVLESLFDA